MEQLMPEIVDVFVEVVAAMNSDESDNYLRQYTGLGNVTTAKFVSLSEHLYSIFGETYTGIHFYAGHPLEILKQIELKDKTIMFEKYPAVCLFLDTPEDHTTKFAFSANSLQLIIACATNPEYTTLERHEKNFVPVLIPIYYELLYQLAKSHKMEPNIVQNIRHQKVNRYYWGKEGLYGAEGNIFNDYLDCIEIKNLQLNFNYLNC